MHTSYIEYIVILLYFVFMIATGVLFRRFNRNFSDYFRSGCRGTWWMVGASVFMASFTAWSFTGAAGAAYTSGISVAIIFLANATGYLINALVTAPIFRQMRATTGPEIIRQRFNTFTQQFYVWVGMIPGIMTASLTLWSTALFTSAVFGYNLQTLIIIIGLVVMIYSVLGGSWSVMANDFLQALILIPMSILVTWLSLQLIGGWSGLVMEIHRQNLPDLLNMIDRHTPNSQFTFPWALAMFVFVLMAYNSAGSATKYFACKDGKEARKAAFLACILMFAGAALWFIPPMVARLKMAGIVDSSHFIGIKNSAEASYAILAMKLLPVGLTGMLVIAMFSATMSSLAPGLNQFAAIMTQDFYKPFIRPKSDEKEIFLVGQITSFFIGFAYIAFALYFSKQQGTGLFDKMLQYGSIFGTPTTIPLFMMLFVRKAPRWAAISSMAFSIPISVMAFMKKWPFQDTIMGYTIDPRVIKFVTEWPYPKTVFIITIMGILGYLFSMLFWKDTTETDKTEIDVFYKRMHTPVDFEKEVGHANDPKQLQFVGWVSLPIGLFLLLLLLLPNTWAGRQHILFVAGFIIFFALMMIWTGWKKAKKAIELQKGKKS